MSSPWSKVANEPVQTASLADIMSEQYAHQLHDKELQQQQKKQTQNQPQQSPTPASYSDVAGTSHSATAAAANDADEWEDYSMLLSGGMDKETLPPEVLKLLEDEEESDAVIAQMLQSQFDHEYNEELRRIERQQNKQSKVTVTLNKFLRSGDAEFLHDTEADEDDEEDELYRQKRDWDRFETNEKMLDAIPKCGFKVDKEGEMITKHDPQLCGVRNAQRVMSFPPEFPTGDGACFDMKLSNKVFNQLKAYSRRGRADRKEKVATAEMGVDAATRLLLYKLINNQILEQINGIISTGKEAVILHANSDASYTGTNEHGHGNGVLMPPELLPRECAIKIFKTTLNEFKQRDRYIKDDYRFKDRFSKQNHRVIINMWAEKEMHNLMRMQSIGLNVPDVVVLKKHVLVMRFIGDNHNAAPKLKDARLTVAELSCAYEEIVAAMHKLYNEAKLVHADLSEYNILWYEDKCWFIDVAQSVEPEHPSALEFLMRDCGNIVNFFEKRGLSNIYTKEQLFESITALNAEKHNTAMLERIHTKGASINQATVPNQQECPDELKPLDYPFELAWEKSQQEREAAAALQELKLEAEAEKLKDKDEDEKLQDNDNNTAKQEQQ
ncbi:serine/threonine-protein kinase RIO3 [Drosophila sulfurigaster albostrigata]|uniref:serine/threonine-protein kinase RIO3 n=1 Tax=Drosophila sulfurigaster albostrigata TaxID=89887 RepID=UPI002D21C12C|nr:serine/threonine-protein kinase RIO3 [Drosophila sulfurigaster albostrigata]